MRISVILLVIMVLLAYIAQAGDVELEVEHGDGHIDHREESHYHGHHGDDDDDDDDDEDDHHHHHHHGHHGHDD
ncbi:Uncharacterized protein PBTT_01001 [Plasmodiophora brassicae]